MMIVSTVVVFLIVVVAGFVPFGVDSAPEVRLPFGIIKGSDKAAVTTSKLYHVYYGIPFATPPLGDLRFKPPEPFVSSDPNRVISSNRRKPACIQDQILEQSEDCLYLNIYTPNATLGRFDGLPLKKVMIWIHGGAYSVGDISYHMPTRMVTDYDVIVVIIQYRLGPLGFLSTGDGTIPGNNGLRDQITAIRWVKDNIRQFGGDGQDITLFAESAGAASLSILAISPLAKGLFTKGIMQSGTVLAPWAFNAKNSEDLFYELARKTNCQPTFYFPGFKSYFNKGIVECLKKVSAEEIRSVDFLKLSPHTMTDLSLIQYIAFTPVVDGDVLPRDPKLLLADKDYLRKVGALDRKYILGVNNQEGILTLELLQYVFNGDIPGDFYSEELISKSNKVITETFLGLTLTPDIINYVDLMYNYPLDSDGKLALQGSLDLITDTSFVLPTVCFASALQQLSPDTEVYMYLMDYFPLLKDEESAVQGSTHGLGLFYLFDEIPSLSDYILYYGKVYTDSSIPVMRNLRSLFTNFAKFGAPTGKGDITTWPRFDLKEQNFLAISEMTEVRQRLYSHRVSLWTEFFPRLIQAIFKAGPGGRSYIV